MIQSIPASVLNASDKKQMFRDLKTWMDQTHGNSTLALADAISSGSKKIDQLLGGGYAPGTITEIVEPLASRGAQSLLHESVQLSRSRLQFMALVDANHQFDPASENAYNLECLLWVRCPRQSDAIKACDILARDGNFPLLFVDLRQRSSIDFNGINANQWYRIQRVCERSRIAFVALTSTSTVPCANARIQLSEFLSLDYLDDTTHRSIDAIDAEVLKLRSRQSTDFEERRRVATVNQ